MSDEGGKEILTTCNELKNKKGSDPTLDGAHIISPQDNAKGSSANPSSGKWQKGGKTMGRKAKKAGVVGWQRAGNKGDRTKGKKRWKRKRKK